MSSWNEIPYDKDASPEVKALEFDLQYEENQRTASEDKSNPYSEDNFNVDRRKK